jgi:hypothetical protein
MHGCLPLALPRLASYPFLPQRPSKLRRVRSPSMIPHLQGWPLNPDLQAFSLQCRPSLTGPDLVPMPPMLSLQAAALTTKASPTTSQQLSPHVPLRNLLALRVSAKHSLCLPKKPMALHTSVQLLRKLIVLLPFPCLIQPQVNSLSIANCDPTPVTRPLGILLMPMS